MPSNSVLDTQDGWNPYDTGVASGRRFWGGYFSVDYPSTETITLVWSVAGAAKKAAHGWHYLYLIQRQVLKSRWICGSHSHHVRLSSINRLAWWHRASNKYNLRKH